MIVYKINSFTKYGQGGNPAGVVVNEYNLSENSMQSIAKKVGYSETIFMTKVTNEGYKAKFFTPNSEVDLCGHATIAGFSLLRDLHQIQHGKYKMHCIAGKLDISVENNNTVFMNQNLPTYCEVIDKNSILNCFDLKSDDISDKYPVQVVTTGMRDILLPITSISALTKMKANYKKICDISKKYNVSGIHAFTTETLKNATAHCRNFAPLYDIPEESATGTANGALSCYMWKYGLIPKKQNADLVFEQGYSMDMPSEIVARLSIKDDKIIEVQVGGKAKKSDKLNIENNINIYNNTMF